MIINKYKSISKRILMISIVEFNKIGIGEGVKKDFVGGGVRYLLVGQIKSKIIRKVMGVDILFIVMLGSNDIK